MGKEIERKFLLKNDHWRAGEGTRYRQGYLSTEKERTVRVRIIGNKGYLTIKGISMGATRLEFEYEIPVEDADELLNDLCAKPLIEKNRYQVEYEGSIWEIDEFFGENEGLIIAELELRTEDQAFSKPPWLGKEVTEDPRYFNSSLTTHPYTQW